MGGEGGFLCICGPQAVRPESRKYQGQEEAPDSAGGKESLCRLRGSLVSSPGFSGSRRVATRPVGLLADGTAAASTAQAMVSLWETPNKHVAVSPERVVWEDLLRF